MPNYPTFSDYANIGEVGNQGTGDNPKSNYWENMFNDMPEGYDLEGNQGGLLSYILNSINQPRMQNMMQPGMNSPYEYLKRP